MDESDGSTGKLYWVSLRVILKQHADEIAIHVRKL
jgi:hypothetical protein